MYVHSQIGVAITLTWFFRYTPSMQWSKLGMIRLSMSVNLLKMSCSACKLTLLFLSLSPNMGGYITRFHPDFHNQNSKIQREMLQYMSTWVQELGHKRDEILQRLTREAVRTHRNVRQMGDGGAPQAQGTYAYNEGLQTQQTIQGYVQGIPGVSQAQSLFNMVSGGPGGRREMPEESFTAPVTEGRYPRPGSPCRSGIGGAPSFPGVSSQFAPPSGPPPPNLSSYASSSGYARPSSPPSFPGAARPGSHVSAYSPAYVSAGPGRGGPSFPETSRPDSNYHSNTRSGYAPAYMNAGSGDRGPSIPEASGAGSDYHSSSTSPYAPSPASSAYTPLAGYSPMGFPSADVPSGRHGPGFPNAPAYGEQESEFRIPSPGRGNRNERQHRQPGHPHGGSYGDRW